MPKTIRLLGLFMLMAFFGGLLAAPAAAKPSVGQVEIEPHVGMLFWEGQFKQRNPSLLLGGRLGYFLTDALALEAVGQWSPSKVEDSDEKFTWIPINGDLLYHFPLTDAWVPFVAAGAGAMLVRTPDENDTGWFLQYGAGLKYYFTDYLALRFDARHKALFDVCGQCGNVAELSMGITLAFGGADDAAPAPAAEEAPKEMVVTKTLTLEGVGFEFDKATLTPEAKATLDNHVKALLANPEAKIEIAGHTCNIGSDSYNQKLSERRANSVLDYLVKGGVASSDRLSSKGYGEKEPIASNDTKAGRASNRRVELRVLEPKK